MGPLTCIHLVSDSSLAYKLVCQLGILNYLVLCIPVKSNLKIQNQRNSVSEYFDHVVGWLIGIWFSCGF